MGALEDRILFGFLVSKGFPIQDRRLVDSEEYLTRGDRSFPAELNRRLPRAQRRSLARNIYAEGTPAGTLSRDWQAMDWERRRSLPNWGTHGDVPYSQVSAEGGRDLGAIKGVVLHTMKFTVPPLTDVPGPPPGDERGLRRYIEHTDHRVDVVIGHFAVLRDGTIAYLHDVTHLLNSASGRRGIDIEFEQDEYRTDRPPPSDPDLRAPAKQIRAGRALVNALRQAFGITTIVTHGQVQAGEQQGKLTVCPGPDIWVNVGVWCRDNLGLSTNARDVFSVDNGFGAQDNPAYDQHV